MHYRDTFQGRTPFKGQLVAQDKATALLYKRYMDEFGLVSAEVLISGPDTREGEDDLYEENKEPVIRFWQAMMDKYGTEKEYNRQLINAFKFGEPPDAPEVIIVVDKLLTGFDAPCNTVLYLTRQLSNHTLLQAIARVNRLHDGKDFGFIIDYRGVLENIDRALDLYSKLPELDKEDLAGLMTDVQAVIDTLPQKHSVLWDVFKDVQNTRDAEEYEMLLADEAVRVRFYERFSDFARTLAVAMSTEIFLEQTPREKVDEYTRDLRFFRELRQSVRRRYAEVVDFSEYEPKIQKLVDTHVGTGDVEQIVGPLDLFDEAQREQALDAPASAASKADTIAHNTLRVIQEKWQEDPAFYKKFSEMIRSAIEAFRAGRISEREYLKRARAGMEAVIDRRDDGVPPRLERNEVAKAYYGVVKEAFDRYADGVEVVDASAEASLGIDRIVQKRRIVNWTGNVDQQNRMRQDIEDYLFDLKDRLGIDLTFEDIDQIMDECLEIAKVRSP